MAALSANRITDQKGGDSSVLVQKIEAPIADNVHIYAGALVQLNAGNATPAGVATQPDSHTFVTVGRSDKEYDNTVAGHSAGALTVEIRQGAFTWDILAGDAVTQANAGASVYAEDDHTIRATNNGNTRASAGKLLAVVTLPELGTQAIVQTVVGLV